MEQGHDVHHNAAPSYTLGYRIIKHIQQTVTLLSANKNPVGGIISFCCGFPEFFRLLGYNAA